MLLQRVMWPYLPLHMTGRGHEASPPFLSLPLPSWIGHHPLDPPVFALLARIFGQILDKIFLKHKTPFLNTRLVEAAENCGSS